MSVSLGLRVFFRGVVFGWGLVGRGVSSCFSSGCSVVCLSVLFLCARAKGGRARGGGEAGAVVSGSVVSVWGCGRGLRVVAFCRGEDCVRFLAVCVVVVSAVFGVGVRGVCRVVAVLVRVFEVVSSVHASHAAFVVFDGVRVVVVECEGGGARFVVAGGGVGGVAAS